ncbi:MAG: exodeoxyribonuclease V subunit beta [Balneolaceae bacterium]
MRKPLKVFEVPINGISLVEASAGTGKTYNITSLYVRAILEKNLNPSQILVMTYTEAATAELKFRLRNRLKESLSAIKSQNPGSDEFLSELIKFPAENAEIKLQTAIDTFDEAAVFTIHGFCSRLLTEYSLQFNVSPDYELLTNDSEVLQDCVDRYWRSFTASVSESDEKDKLILLDYLIDDGFGPDELKDAVEELFKHPHAVPEPTGVNSKELLTKVPKLESKYTEIQKLWNQDGEELEEIFRGDALDRSKYQRRTEDRDWELFQDWLYSKEVKISYPEKLEKFGLKISRSGKKSAPDIPELDICKAIDEFCAIADELKLLKPAFIIESTEEINKDFKNRKESGNLLSYNDLLELVESGIRNDKSGIIARTISSKYPLALVDEFQDTDPIQYGIFNQIYSGRDDKALFMIGDPKQAIYGFRGADIYTYLKARNDADDAQNYSLEYNYRSNSKMIEGVNSLFQLSNSPFLIDGLYFQQAHFPPEREDDNYLMNSEGEVINPLQSILLEGNDKSNKGDISDQIYEAVSNEIIELLSGNYKINGEIVRQKDIAILIRTGYQGEAIQERLRQKGLKSVLKSRSSVFNTKEADELFIVLKAIQKLSYEPGIRTALATELIGFSAKEIQHLLEDESEWTSIVEQFIRLKQIWDKKGIEPVIEHFFMQFNTLHILSNKKNAERRITNLLHIAELLAKAQRENKLHGMALLKWFYSKTNEDSSDSEDEQLRLESDENLIQISTIHGAKGLQYPIVFCPFLWDSGSSISKKDILKFYKDGAVHIDVSTGVSHDNRGHFDKLTQFQALAEEVRLTYVALTRSVSACYLFLPDYKKIHESPIASIVTGVSEEIIADFTTIKSALESKEFIDVREPIIQKQNEPDIGSDESIQITNAANFSRKDVFNFPRMMSYSSLTGSKEIDEGAHDYDFNYEVTEPEIVKLDKFGFPKGANAGTCLHKIFEDLHFYSPVNISKVISKNLDYYGFDEKWQKPVQEWINEALFHDLNEPDISLSALGESDVLKEMEFYFPIKSVDAKEIWGFIRDDSPDIGNTDHVFGYMKGFIDLTFKCDDKYYILDYKSNYLGDTLSEYSSDNLKQAIMNAGYDLQYHIYTLALHRFLTHSLSGYEYEKHFGGVLYYFLRGINPEKAGSGVFFECPEYSLIQKLDHYFRKGGRS